MCRWKQKIVGKSVYRKGLTFAGENKSLAKGHHFSKKKNVNQISLCLLTSLEVFNFLNKYIVFKKTQYSTFFFNLKKIKIKFVNTYVNYFCTIQIFQILTVFPSIYPKSVPMICHQHRV